MYYFVYLDFWIFFFLLLLLSYLLLLLLLFHALTPLSLAWHGFAHPFGCRSSSHTRHLTNIEMPWIRYIIILPLWCLRSCVHLLLDPLGPYVKKVSDWDVIQRTSRENGVAHHRTISFFFFFFLYWYASLPFSSFFFTPFLCRCYSRIYPQRAAQTDAPGMYTFWTPLPRWGAGKFPSSLVPNVALSPLPSSHRLYSRTASWTCVAPCAELW